MTDQPVTHVREQQYVATCAQCKAKARGAFHEFIESGWNIAPAEQYGQTGAPLFFCPACVLGLVRVAPTA